MENAETNSRSTIPVAREELEVGRRRVDQGSVRVRKVVSESVVRVEEEAKHEEVSIERVEINRPVQGPSEARHEGEVLVIPVFEEIVTVQRQWILKEELRVHRRTVTVPRSEDVVLREEQVTVERIPPSAKK